MQPAFSLVIPAYNERHRLPFYLAQVRAYLDAQFAGQYEVIVVDDGSDDGLTEVLEASARTWPQLKVLRHKVNRGKGAAVRTGMLAAEGELLLFADADGAAPIDQEARLRAAIHSGAEVAVGSRRLSPEQSVRRRPLRRLAGWLFATVARWSLALAVRDTQCGFKMFRRGAGRRLFELARENGFLFDLELLVLARHLGYRVAEVPIQWSDMPGGHLSLARQGPKVLFDLWRLRRRLKADHGGAPGAAGPQP